MNYVKHILLPGEQVLYDGHVHPTVLLPGLLLLALASWILTGTGNTGEAYSVVLGVASFLAGYMPFFVPIYNKLAHWADASPTMDLDLKVLATLIAFYGFARLSIGFILMESTELIVTDSRIIAKRGVFTITTVEMDRRRIAGVTVYQTVAGRIMGYGYVMIQGFTSRIAGLPPMVNPHLVEKFVS